MALADDLAGIGIDPGQFPATTGSGGLGIATASAPSGLQRFGQGAANFAAGFNGQPAPFPSGGGGLGLSGAAQDNRTGLQKFGDLMTNVSRGVQGRGLNSAELEAQRLGVEQIRISNLSDSVNTLTQVSEILKNVDPTQRAAMGDSFRSSLPPEMQSLFDAAIANDVDFDFTPFETLAQEDEPLKSLLSLRGAMPEDEFVSAITKALPGAWERVNEKRQEIRALEVGKEARAAWEEYQKTFPDQANAILEDGKIDAAEIPKILNELGRDSESDDTQWAQRNLARLKDFLPVDVTDPTFEQKEKIKSREQIRVARAKAGLKGTGAGTPRNVFFPGADGGQSRILNSRGGRFFDPNTGQPVFVPEGAQITQVAGAPEDFDGGLAGKKARERAGEAAGATAGRIASVKDMNDTVERLGASVTGLSGLAMDVVFEPLAAVNEGFGNQLSEWIIGTTPQERTDFKSTAQAVVAQSISTFTGEQSGRFTDKEQALAREATRLINTTASFESIKQAVQVMTVLLVAFEDSQKIQAGQGGMHDLDTEEGELAMADRLGQLGMTGPSALRAINIMRTQRRLLSEQGVLR